MEGRKEGKESRRGKGEGKGDGGRGWWRETGIEEGGKREVCLLDAAQCYLAKISFKVCSVSPVTFCAGKVIKKSLGQRKMWPSLSM